MVIYIYIYTLKPYVKKFALEDSYKQNGVLDMLDRNRRIKRNPEKFQTSTEPFDIILSCEGKL